MTSWSSVWSIVWERKSMASNKHECSYGGSELQYQPCGYRGSLCDMCKEDRADVRAALQGLLANSETSHPFKWDETTFNSAVEIATKMARKIQETKDRITPQ